MVSNTTFELKKAIDYRKKQASLNCMSDVADIIRMLMMHV